MKIGILSDVHDNIWNLRKALDRLHDADVLLCCGDLCSPFVIVQLGQGFERDIHIVFGNNDADLFRISLQAKRFPQIHLHGELAELELGGRRIAMQHFDNIARPLAESGRYDLVCFGHNHTCEITEVGEAILLNPGEVMGGLSEGPRATVAVYDTSTGHPEILDL